MFTIAGPDTTTTSVARLINGVPVRTNLVAPVKVGVPAALRTRCLVDTFSVTNPAGNAPPLICGSNTGDHSQSFLPFSSKYRPCVSPRVQCMSLPRTPATC